MCSIIFIINSSPSPPPQRKCSGAPLLGLAISIYHPISSVTGVSLGWKSGLILVASSASMMFFWKIFSLLLMGNELLVAGDLEVSCVVSALGGRKRFNLVVRRKSNFL